MPSSASAVVVVVAVAIVIVAHYLHSNSLMPIVSRISKDLVLLRCSLPAALPRTLCLAVA